MSRVVNLEDVRGVIAPRESCIAVGVFDGVHLGHQNIIGRLRSCAARTGLVAAVLTFDPHPLVVVRGEAPPLLMELDERTEFIARLGIDLVTVARFDSRMAELSPVAFAGGILLERLRARHVVVGFNFTFGKGAAGDANRLVSLGKELGFSVDVVKPVLIEGQIVGSSEIRRLIRIGDMELAARMLGRPFSLRGKVMSGARRGRALGFPTANLAVSSELAIPRDGVYAVRIPVGATIYPGVLNIGVKPTFGGGARTLEVHIVGFNGDLYGAQIRVEFLKRLRDERQFPEVPLLQAQIEQDIMIARSLLEDARMMMVYKPRALC